MEKNKGFSLIELIVSVAILAIIITAVTSVILSASRSFTRGNADANIQKEAQLVVNQVESMIVDTNGGVDYVEDTTAGTKELVLFNASDDGAGSAVYTEESIKWIDSSNTIVYSKYEVSYNESTGAYVRGTAEFSDELLAENVTSFLVDVSDTKREYAKDGIPIDIVQSVSIKMECTDSTGQVTYATSPLVTLRNRMMLSDSPSLVFANTPAVTDTLAIYMSSYVGGVYVPRELIQDMVTPVVKGATYKVYVMVNAANDINDLVNWTIEESGTTSTIDSTGELVIGAAEPNTYLTVVATYKNNSSKQAKAVVKVQ